MIKPFLSSALHLLNLYCLGPHTQHSFDPQGVKIRPVLFSQTGTNQPKEVLEVQGYSNSENVTTRDARERSVSVR